MTKSPITTIAHLGILLGLMYLVAFGTKTLFGAIIGTIIGILAGPIGVVIGTLVGIITDFILKL